MMIPMLLKFLARITNTFMQLGQEILFMQLINILVMKIENIWEVLLVQLLLKQQSLFIQNHRLLQFQKEISLVNLKIYRKYHSNKFNIYTVESRCLKEYINPPMRYQLSWQSVCLPSRRPPVRDRRTAPIYKDEIYNKVFIVISYFFMRWRRILKF